MFSWVTLLKGLVGLASKVAEYVHDKQLLDAGAAMAIKDNLYDTAKSLERADAARRNVKYDADSMRNDKNDRANR